MASLSTYRVYANSYDSFANLANVNLNELHVVLVFARDYDSRGKPTNGVFHPYFQTTNLTPNDITKFKRDALCKNVKFFLSIGGRNQAYPFQPLNLHDWRANAVRSLGDIITDYNLDGIDIYYEYVSSNNPNAGGQFVNQMKDVIRDLRNSNTQLKTSITVSAPVSDVFYSKLAQQATPDYVIYQTHSQVTPVTNPGDLVQVINALTYPKNKLLVGHSFLKVDWDTVAPPVFYGALHQLTIQSFGISMVCDDDRA